MHEVIVVARQEQGWWARVRARNRRRAAFTLAVVVLAGIDLIYHFLPQAVKRLRGGLSAGSK